MTTKLLKGALTRIAAAAIAAVFFTPTASAVVIGGDIENPVTGETESYENIFTGETAEWNNAANWDTSTTPFITTTYSPALVNGAKTVSTSTAIDGWTLRVYDYIDLSRDARLADGVHLLVLGAEYIGRRVGSELVTMHEGALCASDVTTYAFDDEGTLAGDVTEIDRGILRTGICDALSALRLGTVPTGNGKRENFEHKVYTRMTNTIFDSGSDKLEDMIASIDYGFLLEGMESGMEDPKHWGIQCILKLGREIKDGRLTGKVFAPIIMTGYVPDLLGSISMLSADREVFGNGGCGKGHKEWVKVADGGPYMKMKARLG